MDVKKPTPIARPDRQMPEQEPIQETSRPDATTQSSSELLQPRLWKRSHQVSKSIERCPFCSLTFRGLRGHLTSMLVLEDDEHEPAKAKKLLESRDSHCPLENNEDPEKKLECDNIRIKEAKTAPLPSEPQIPSQVDQNHENQPRNEVRKLYEKSYPKSTVVKAKLQISNLTKLPKSPTDCIQNSVKFGRKPEQISNADQSFVSDEEPMSQDHVEISDITGAPFSLQSDCYDATKEDKTKPTLRNMVCHPSNQGQPDVKVDEPETAFLEDRILATDLDFVTQEELDNTESLDLHLSTCYNLGCGYSASGTEENVDLNQETVLESTKEQDSKTAGSGLGLTSPL
ncbi:hypothetical protein B0J14DRAFT_671772 [Halenospora varia]|nr:hypothetical protein B0J14DRAFT_671772 [Halenospora varia]